MSSSAVTPGGLSQRGAIFLAFLISSSAVISLFGAVTESTLLLTARSQLFNGAETALLDAANLYTTTTNQTTITETLKTDYCTKNSLVPANTSLDFSQIANNMLILTTTKSVPFFFLPSKTMTLTATMAAEIPQPAGSLGNLAPLVIQQSSWTEGASYTLKEGAGDGTTGNYGALDLGSGAAAFESALKYGYNGTLAINQSVSTKTGNMAGPTGDGISFRLNDSNPANDIVLVVVTNSSWPNGASAPITIIGFAAFKVSSVVTSGSHAGEITGTFVNTKSSYATATPGAPDYGVYTRPKLIYY